MLRTEVETPMAVDAVDEDGGATVLETLCMCCMKSGTSRLLLTVIPHFKGKIRWLDPTTSNAFAEVIIASFECPHCGYSNREVQSGASLAEFGVRYILSVNSLVDLNRQIVKSDTATVSLPELEFEIPAHRGSCNTLEGLLDDAVTDLEAEQSKRQDSDPAVADIVQRTVDQLKRLLRGEQFPFIVTLDDPSGNSNIEALTVSQPTDSNLKVQHYKRTKGQLHSMGFYEEGADPQENAIVADSLERPGPPTATLGDQVPNRLRATGWDLALTVEENIARINEAHRDGKEVDEREGLVFDVNCPDCGKSGQHEMCEVDIPGFRQCMIMAFNCTNCGSRSNEVKPMGAYGEQARRWTLKVETVEDLNRDVLKSDTASVRIPELDFEMFMGTLGGVFTTVEGLISKVVEQLAGSGDMFSGDSADLAQKTAFAELLKSLKSLIEDPGRLPFTLVLDDAADLSMISSRHPPYRVPGASNSDGDALQQADEDENLVVVAYERTAEQNDELGITHMKVEGYEEDAAPHAPAT